MDRDTRLQLLQFCLVGMVSLGANVLTLSLSYGVIGIPRAIAVVLAHAAAILIGLLLNNVWTFSAQTAKRFTPETTVKYLIVSGMGIVANILLLPVFQHGLPLPVAQAVSVLITVPFLFAGSKFWAFSNGAAHTPEPTV